MERRRQTAVACALALALMLSSGVSSASWGQSRNYTKTRYPIVLVPGVLGFNKLFGSIEYFYGIPGSLRDSGATVYVVDLSAFDSPDVRSEQLLQQLRYISAVSGSTKLNVIGHSQGGVDARYALAARPDLFASLTTVGSPHTGTGVADFIVANTTSTGFLRSVGTTVVDGLGALLNLIGGSPRPQDSEQMLIALSSAHAGEVNGRLPAGLPSQRCGSGAADFQGVKLYSWGGTSPFTNPLDPTDYAFGVASLFANGESDGLVERCSTHFGTVIRDDYTFNHGDEINQVLGAVNIFATSPSSVFRTHANRLQNASL